MPDTPGVRPGAEQPGAPTALLRAARARLAEPGLVVLTGAPGIGRSSTLRAVAESFRGTVHAGGGLAILRGVPGLALSRAVRARLPVDDVALTTEAVRSRVRGGLLVLDDLQWLDAVSLAALPGLAEHCRVLVALRTPHRLPAAALRGLRGAAALWLAVPPCGTAAAVALAHRVAPGLSPAAAAAVAERAGGIPLAVESLARHAAAHPESLATAEAGQPSVARAVAEGLADLTRPARTAMAALGMLRRPAAPGLLGAGAEEVREAGLAVEAGAGALAPVSPYVAEVAAGLLSEDERAALHRRLADLVGDAEAARHLAAAGDDAAAYRRAVAAAQAADTLGERAELLLLACGLPGAPAGAAHRRQAAEAALAAGRPRAALRVVGDDADAPMALARGEALLQMGDAAAAAAAVVSVPDGAEAASVAARDRVRLLAALSGDADAVAALVAEVMARHGGAPRHTGLRAALAAAAAARREAGWEAGLATAAAAAGRGGDVLAARWSAWLLTETLAADGRLAEAAEAAAMAAAACAAEAAYSWQTRFLAAELWCAALAGHDLDEVARRAVGLLDHTMPAVAAGYATAAASLAEADSGLLASARARLADRDGPVAGGVSAVLDWVAAEAAWLDGQPAAAAGGDRPASRPPLLAGLAAITDRWAAAEGASSAGAGAAVPAPADGWPAPVVATLRAWSAAAADPAGADFDAAARAWRPVARREEVRCLLARGRYAGTEQAVAALLAAEQVAESAGLVVLLGRTRRALRRHAVRRETRGPRAGSALTGRERDVLRLVAAGEPTRRIAGLLGISRETVETHIRAGMRKLGARTRTEAAALALELVS